MIAVIDYKAGNLCSVGNALHRIGADFVVTADSELIRRADHVLLPGVGEAAHAMAELRARGLDSLIPTLTQPVLGICIGIQLLCQSSEEGNTSCLGVFPTEVRRLVAPKVPEMGWNQICNLSSPLFRGVNEGSFVYYVHSFAPAIVEECTIATTDYFGTFSGALAFRNFFGTQFHPEKSGLVGEQILKNFLSL